VGVGVDQSDGGGFRGGAGGDRGECVFDRTVDGIRGAVGLVGVGDRSLYFGGVGGGGISGVEGGAVESDRGVEV